VVLLAVGVAAVLLIDDLVLGGDPPSDAKLRDRFVREQQTFTAPLRMSDEDRNLSHPRARGR
jgi:hypothetical protein